MTLEIKAAPSFDAEIFETVWAGDSAVDREASDLAGWAATADKEYLTFKPSADPPSIIQFRALTDREMAVLPKATDEDQLFHPLYFIECARYGVTKIKGVSLSKSRTGSVVGLDDKSLDKLISMRAEVPLDLAFMVLDESAERPENPEMVNTSLAQWLGIIIFGRSFQKRK